MAEELNADEGDRSSDCRNPSLVSVIVPTFRHWESLARCMNALADQTYPQSVLEILVINNDPADRPPTPLLPDNARLLEESIPGSYAARNRGLDEARGEIVAFTDADCIPDPAWIQRAVARLQGGCERVAGRVELVYRSDRLTWAESYEKIFAFNQIGYVCQGKAVTANLVTWRWAFDRVGLFNPELLSGGDMEWGERASAAGLGITYAPEVVALHPARASFREIAAKRQRVSGSKRMIQRHRDDSVVLLILIGVLPPVRAMARVLLRREIRPVARLAVAGMIYWLQLIETFYKSRVLIRDRLARASIGRTHRDRS